MTSLTMQTHNKKVTRDCAHAGQSTINKWKIVSNTSSLVIVLFMVFSLASALTTQRPRSIAPGHYGIHTNSNVRSPVTITPLHTESKQTELLYSHGDDFEEDNRRNEHRAAVIRMRSRFSVWWSTILPAVAPVGKDVEQEKVDDYLEFLDRRYHRLHDNEEKKVTFKAAKSFQVLDWLADNNQRSSSFAAAQSQEDALFVLGVAELASTRFLQRHHIPLDANGSSPVVDTVASTIAVKTTTPSLISQRLSKPSKAVVDHIKSRRHAWIVFQEKQLKKLLSATIMIALQIPLRFVDSVKAIWKYGGGKRSMALSFGVLSTFFFLLRPIAFGVVGVVFDSGFAES